MTTVCLIRPPVLIAKWAHTTPTCPPIGLAYIAGSLMEDHHDVSTVDAVGEAVEQFLPADDPRFVSHGLSAEEIATRIPEGTNVIAISCMFSHEWPLTREIIKTIRKRFPLSKIIAGGEHITALPEFSLTDCEELDFGVIGEGEETARELLQCIENESDVADIAGIVFRQGGGITITPPRARLRAVDEIPKPDWDAFPLEAYLANGYGFGVHRGRSMPIIATRGCPYQCTFCSNPAMWGTRWVSRTPQQVFQEMMEYKEKYAIDNFDFYDLTAIVKKKWIVEFCQIIADHGEPFTWQLPSGTRSEAIDSEVAQLLYESGCRNISYAPESGSPAILERIKKKIKLPEMKHSMRESIRNGINCKANIIIGFPTETHKEIWETLWFTLQMAWLGLHDMSISPFSPYPGSELFNKMREQDKIDDLSDSYFYSLAAYTDITKTISCSEFISDRALGFYRTFGMLLFYSALYLTRPWRFFISIRNALGDQQESRLEMSLKDLFKRLRQSNRADV